MALKASVLSSHLALPSPFFATLRQAKEQQAYAQSQSVARQPAPAPSAAAVADNIALTWSANTLEIIAIASRAFAFYYLLQCLVAVTVSRSFWQRIGMLAVASVLAFITIFAVPAS